MRGCHEIYFVVLIILFYLYYKNWHNNSNNKNNRHYNNSNNCSDNAQQQWKQLKHHLQQQQQINNNNNSKTLTWSVLIMTTVDEFFPHVFVSNDDDECVTSLADVTGMRRVDSIASRDPTWKWTPVLSFVFVRGNVHTPFVSVSKGFFFRIARILYLCNDKFYEKLLL